MDIFKNFILLIVFCWEEEVGGSFCHLYHVSIVFQRLFAQSVRIGCNVVEFFL